MDERFILPDLARDILMDSPFFSDDPLDEAPFQAKLYEADPSIMVIVGENASGKSLLYRVIQGYAQKQKVTGITISIRERSGGGVHEMGGMRRAFMFGDEAEQSTGATSANVVVNGFHNAYSGQHGKTLLMLDEPEMGLSDGYARALGEYIGASTLSITDTCLGVLVVTHNRALVQGLLKGFTAPPSFVHMGENPVDLDAWVSGEAEHRSITDLMGLRDLALARRRATAKIIRENKQAAD